MAQASQLTVRLKGIAAVTGHIQPHCGRQGMPAIVIPAVLAAVGMMATKAAAQTCLRPKWTECVAFPAGGRHTGVSPQGAAIEMEVTPGAEICVGNEEEIGAQTFSQFWRSGVPWPDRDWEVNSETFCFYKN
ncbi:MAG TPA: hypothetical protein VG291_20905 [Xanthobacteraceae bacterium]|jgi:hypothetical protein|nr:hypothetical protein [Xanthobacteraceae bacterium]